MHFHTRRDFLRHSGTAGLAAAAAALFPGLARANAMGLPPGIQLYSVRDNMATDIPGTLKQIAAIGFVEVETAGFGKYSAREFRQFLDDAGLKAPSAHLQLTPSKYEPFFDDAKTIGAQYAVSSSLHSTMDPPSTAGLAPGQRPTMAPLGLSGFQRLAEAMNDLGTKARAAGLQYAYHNHNYEFEKLPDGRYGYDVLVNNTDHDLVKFEIDCGWMSAAGASPVDYMTRYPGRFRMIHVKEFQAMAGPSTSLAGAARPKGTDLGQGFIDYQPIFAASRKAGIQHAFSEQEAPYPISQMESAKAAFAFLDAAS